MTIIKKHQHLIAIDTAIRVFKTLNNFWKILPYLALSITFMRKLNKEI